MKKALVFIGITCLFAVVYSCNKSGDITPNDKGQVYLDLPDSTHRYNQFNNSDINEKITLGRVLFYERHLSVNNSISCGSCHKQAFAFSDNVALSRGFENKLTTRNSPAIQNLGSSGFGFFTGNGNAGGGQFGNGSLFWDGREQNLASLVSRPIANHVEMGIDDLTQLPQKLSELPYYSTLFNKAYGSSDISVEKISDAIAYFLAALESTNTRFDAAQHNSISFSGLELEGQTLFTQKYNCAGCHNENIGGYFSGSFMDIGLDASYKDLGVGAISGSTADRGKFKVPNLRNVALTAPYMHDGRFKTLDDVLEHYSHGINNTPNLDARLKIGVQPMRMNISTQEKQALIAFLNTLTDNDLITNPYFADPFKTK